MSSRTTFPMAACLFSSLLLTGCYQPLQVRTLDHRIKLDIDPPSHNLTAQSTMKLTPLPNQSLPEGEVRLLLNLNENLDITDVAVEGGELRRTGTVAPAGVPDDHEGAINYRTHYIDLERPSRELTLTIDYAGKLKQDVAAGEKAGQIHNFQMSAHVGPDGTYLAPDGYWYPTPAIVDDDIDPDLLLAEWSIEAGDIEDYELIASARRESAPTGKHKWTSPHKLTGITLVGGPQDVWSQSFGDVDIRVHMKRADDADQRQQNEQVAQTYLNRTAEYINRYENLIGPFPYDQYTIIENFFSSGFAFPMITLFGPVVMHMGDNSFRHGYLDHELVHSWWGCGVEVDPRDGNWCEALTSYCTNYYGFIEDGDYEGARKKRRNESNFLSRIKPENDKPLATYGQKDGAGRGISYSKGSAVFHMLAREIGQENFWAACRALTESHMGRHANWDDLKKSFESASGKNLDRFFSQWIRGAGAPMLTLTKAEYDAPAGDLHVTLDQGETEFTVDVPLRLTYADRIEDVTVSMTRPHETLVLALNQQPQAVELDPDYHIFRKLDRSEIMPTTATTKAAKTLTIVTPDGDYPNAYDTVADAFEKPVEDRDGGSVQRTSANDTHATATLTQDSVLILGEAVRHQAVQSLLSRTDSPVRWIENGFAIDDDYYTAPNHAVMFTVHHPDQPDDGITVYYGNSESALANAAILGFYANSLLGFECQDRCEVVERKDFESTQRLEVKVLR